VVIFLEYSRMDGLEMRGNAPKRPTKGKVSGHSSWKYKEFGLKENYQCTPDEFGVLRPSPNLDDYEIPIFEETRGEPENHGIPMYGNGLVLTDDTNPTKLENSNKNILRNRAWQAYLYYVDKKKTEIARAVKRLNGTPLAEKLGPKFNLVATGGPGAGAGARKSLRLRRLRKSKSRQKKTRRQRK
jgi:hypothetical protein